ncbi:TlpA family protein disulfide reductase [Olivibacter sp. SDN3]|uniref:TlpA family protein disulfide reductase n=1 Tax=Olivibacter sp. SDN3 TaxID=2764720 RepID=UPI0016510091|nr:TlpA disulfide reductase family protein [Olivibacter sp. SDN3]QNL48038.1 TlpA family protein disulfide reductase [Olivibacter sp. SDN3]
MKSQLLLALSLLFFQVHNISAQYLSEVKISPEKPQVGDSVSFEYQLPDSIEIQRVLLCYFEDPENRKQEQLTTNQENGKITGGFVVSEATSFFVISIEDTNDKRRGAYAPIHEGDVSVPYATGIEGMLYTTDLGDFLLGIPQNVKKGLELIDEEIIAYPKNRLSFTMNKAQALRDLNRKREAKTLVDDAKKTIMADSTAKEKELMQVFTAYEYVLEDETKANEIEMLTLERFPYGNTAYRKKEDTLHKAEQFTDKEALYQELMDDRFSETRKGKTQDYIHADLAHSAYKAGELEDFEKYAERISYLDERAMLYNAIAWPLAEKNEDIAFAERLSAQSIQLLERIIADKESGNTASTEQQKNRAARNLKVCADTYALIRYHQGEYADALRYQEQAMDGGLVDTEGNERYVMYLYKTGKFDQIPDFAEKAIIAGKSNEELVNYFKEVYLKQAGADSSSWAAHLDELHEKYLVAARKELREQMIQQDAPLFSLVNLAGELVSLESLKGKIVVVDFWATWCGPCKQSFPAMQMAVNKYREDEDVEFLFINTWERIKERDAAVRRFITDHSYTFNVLMDTEGQKGKFDIVTAFEVNGIPTKFVIDQSGQIRFKAIGYSGSPDEELKKISLMVDLLRDQVNEGLAGIFPGYFP